MVSARPSTHAGSNEPEKPNPYQVEADSSAARLPGIELPWYDLKQFPYAPLVGTAGDGQRLVLAVAHHKRRPGYWKTRMDSL